MSQRLLLGIDLGTTACRAIVVSVDGRILGEADQDYPLITRDPGMIEQHAQDWWRVASAAARQAVADSGAPGREVCAVCVTSQEMSVVPVGREGTVLRPAISRLDTRAGEQMDRVLQSVGEAELFRVTGKRPHAAYTLPKIMWLRDHEPEVYENTHRFLLSHDYLIHRLAGCFTTDHSLASGTLAHDVSRLDWSDTMLDAAGVDRARLPEPSWAGKDVCPIIRESAETLGISREAKVICGGLDASCAALGAGQQRGTVVISLGTSSAISAVTDGPVLDDRRRLQCFPFVTQDTWSLEGVVPSSGGALKWFKEAFFQGSSYPLIDEMASDEFADTSGLFFYPHLAGAGSPVWKADLPGILYGISPSTTSSSFARAVLEGVAYQVRSNVEAMMELGVSVEQVKVFGGGTRGSLWVQIIADVLGREVLVPATTEAAAVGACVLAGVGCGAFEDAQAGAAAFARGETLVTPSPERSAAYDERYARYREVEKRLS